VHEKHKWIRSVSLIQWQIRIAVAGLVWPNIIGHLLPLTLRKGVADVHLERREPGFTSWLRRVEDFHVQTANLYGASTDWPWTSLRRVRRPFIEWSGITTLRLDEDGSLFLTLGCVSAAPKNRQTQP